MLEYIKKIGKRILATAALTGAILCIGCNPYAGKRLEEVVAMVNSPDDAQDFINMNLDYAYEDLGVQRYTALNGAEVQGFRKTFDRKKGVCRDGAVAVAAMLQDDGYPARVLDVTWTGGDWGGHSVFIYQDGKGRWGSAGINASDRRHTVFSSLESLARDVAGDFNGNYTGYILHDLSLVNLIEGTNEGLVAKEPFKKEAVSTYWALSINYTTLKIPTGFEHNWETATPEKTSINRNKYTEDLFLDETKTTSEELGAKYEEQWNVLMRAPCRLPSETFRTTIVNDETSTIHTWTIYNYFNKMQQETVERRTQGALAFYSLDTREYNPDQTLAVQRVETSNNGDYIIDQIVRIEIHPDGSMTSYFDTNADGTWDSVTTNP